MRGKSAMGIRLSVCEKGEQAAQALLGAAALAFQDAPPKRCASERAQRRRGSARFAVASPAQTAPGHLLRATRAWREASRVERRARIRKASDKADRLESRAPSGFARKMPICVVALLGFVVLATTFVARLASGAFFVS